MTYSNRDDAHVRRAARIAAPLFYTTNAKDHPDKRQGIILVKDDAPEWVSDLCHKAHQDGSDSIGLGMLPDDWRYVFISEALDAIAESDDDADLDELAYEFADDVDIYTSKLTEWLGSRADRHGYVDEAREEFGEGSLTGIMGDIARGQYMERREVFGLVLDALADVELGPEELSGVALAEHLANNHDTEALPDGDWQALHASQHESADR